MAKLSKFRTRSLIGALKAPKPPTINTSVSFTQCVDHYATFYYDGNGNFYVQSREPGGGIHTGRGDCGGELQGDILRYSFNKNGYSNATGSISMSGRSGSATYNFSNWGVGSSNGPHGIGVEDGGAGAGIYSFTLSVNVIA